MALTCAAFAKVNLYLHVTGKRENGYHELDSLICFAQTGDVLTFETAANLSLDVTGPMAPLLADAKGDNLVLRAARGLQKLCKTDLGAKITLEKHLPVAAGVGGGSGDAAATLKGLCALWQVFPDPEGLQALALSLGADVPICLKAHAAHVGGVGDVITPLAPLPACWMVLVNPMVTVSTPTVFQARRGGFTAAMPLHGEYDFEQLVSELSKRHNDLMAPAIEIAPVIKDVLAAFGDKKGCALTRMSGSGATCFGLFQNEGAAKLACAELKNFHSDWWVSCGEII